MNPYRTPPGQEVEADKPWPLVWLVVAGLLTWTIVVHGLGALAGRW